jgi:nucleotide-binding universal stress UspA family protein
MKVLIGYDGSDCADVALADLARAGLPEGGEALVVSVADVWLGPSSEGEVAGLPPAKTDAESSSPSREQAIKALEEAERLARDAAARARAILPGWEVGAEAYADSPAWGLVKRADQWKPDLLVVGSHGRSAISQLILGSVSQKALNEARCSVRIARGKPLEGSSPVRLVVGVDGSAGSSRAVEEVATRNWPEGSEVRVVAAINLMMATALEWIEEVYDDEWGWVNKVVEAAAARLHEAGLAVTSVIKEGDPKRILRDEAEKWKADSIFVGARGLRRIERFLLGSVSSAVAARAHCSVEVVRERDPEDAPREESQ